MSNKRVLKQLASSLAAYPPPSIDVNLVHHLPTPPPSPEETGSEHDNAEQLLQSLQSQISATMEAIELVQRRQQVLAEVIERAAAMASVAPVVNGDEAKSSKTKRKGNGGGGDVGPCGWEPMLVWDDDEVRAWQGTEGEGTSQADGDVACMLPKRRCERHLGWQRTANASLEMEARALVGQLLSS
jgi:COMPASS component SPP1